MLGRNDPIFIDHDSPLEYKLSKRELVLGGSTIIALPLLGVVLKEAFPICLSIYACAALVAGMGLTWVLRRGDKRREADIPSTPQLIMVLGCYLSAIALPIGAISNLLSREAVSNMGPAPAFADDLNTLGALFAVLSPMVEILIRIWAIKVARARVAKTNADESALNQVATLEKLAYQDSLTGLPNRRCFEVSLTQLRTEGQEFAVVFVDFDKFKPINDLHGHAVGDEFLQSIATRIASLVRSSDLVARLGGDEFAVLIKGSDAKSTSTHLAERLTQAMQEPVVCTGVDLRSSASIGIAVGHSGLDTVDHVVHQADIAMYEAKRSGGARYCIAA